MTPEKIRFARLVGAAATATFGAIALGGWGVQAVAAQHRATGIASLPASAILTRSAAALAHENAIAITGSMNLGPETIVLSVRSTSRGAKVAGDIDIKSGATNSGAVHFVDVGGNVYLEAAAPFWRQEMASSVSSAPAGAVETAVLSKLAGHWIEIGGAEAKSFSSGFGGLTEPGKFAQGLLTGNGKLTKGAPRVLRGRRVLPIASSAGGTIYVSLTGAPLPRGIVGTQIAGGKRVSADVAFSYPTSLAITPPSGALTLSQIVRSLLG